MLRSIVLSSALLGAASACFGNEVPPGFHFAGYSLRVNSGPSAYELLGDEAELGGVKLSPGLADKATGSLRFPAGGATLSPSQAAGSTVRGDRIRALRLPGGGDGSSARHGVRALWKGTAIVNLEGPDVVVFESGDTKDGPEAFAVRVRDALTGNWSTWRYKSNDGFDHYSANSADGAFSTAFNLDDFGIAYGGFVDAVEIVNMMPVDRVKAEGDSSQGGEVVFGTVGDAAGAMPDPRSRIISAFSDVNGFDPDILYVGSLQPIATVPARTAADTK